MSETLGSLVDKLSIVNVKLYMVQDVVHHAAAHGLGLDPETVQRLTALNMQRTGLINEINHANGEDEQIVKLVDTGQAKS